MEEIWNRSQTESIWSSFGLLFEYRTFRVSTAMSVCTPVSGWFHCVVSSWLRLGDVLKQPVLLSIV